MIRVYIGNCGSTYKEQHAAAYEMLFESIKKLYGFSVSFKDISRTEKGKPYFPDIPVSFNISHCKGFAAAAVTERENGEVGTDCENIRICRQNTAARAFTPAERQFILSSSDINLTYTKLWTLKESYVKYTGTGLAGHMQDISFSLDGDTVISSEKSAEFFTRMTDNGTIISLCCRKGQTAEFYFKR